MLCRVISCAIRRGFRTEIFENFRGRKIFRSKSREIAPKSMPPGGAQLAHDPLEVPNICCERQHAVAREISGDLELISDRNFRKFSRPQNFAFEIARDRAEIHAAWWCAASSRPLEVPNICCERQHAVACAIACDLERISDRNFCGRKNFAFEIA